MAGHVGTRVSDDLAQKLDLMRQLKGLNSVSDVIRIYIEEGIERDAKDIQAKVEARLAAEAERMQQLVAALSAPPAPDSEDAADEDADADPTA